MNLTELSYNLRKYAPHVVITIIILLIFYYSIKLFFVYLEMQKVKPLVISPIFGKIKKLEIKDIIEKNNYTYDIDTIEGKPVTATSSAKVFFLIPTTTKIGYREKITFMAKTFGFDTDKVKYNFEGDTQTIFKDNLQELRIDITNYNFQYLYNYEDNSAIFDGTSIPERGQIEDAAINILAKINRYPEELARGQIKINYLLYKSEINKFTFLPTSEDANVIEVDFYRPDIDNFPVISKQYIQSQNNLLLIFKDGNFKILRANINFFDKSETQVGVYPVKTGQQAWDKLASGAAMIVKAPQDGDKIVIKKMSLAYLDPDFYQPYLQPVYVFLGDPDFVAYVPALTDEYLSE